MASDSASSARESQEAANSEWARAHAQAILHSSNDAIVSKSLDGIIRSWNAAAQRIFGYTSEEAVGRPISIIIPPDRAHEESELLGRLRKGESIHGLETVRLNKDGTRVPVRLNITPLKDASGVPIGATNVARDLTAQRQLELRILLQEERLRIMLASIGDGVLVTDVRCNVTYVNPVAEKLTGWTLAQAQGKPLESVFNIIDENTRCRMVNPAARAMREGQAVGLDGPALLVTHSGQEIAIDDSAAPIRGADEQITGVIIVFRDVTVSRAAWNTRAKLSAIVESSDDAIVGKNLQGMITSWNEGAQRIFGYTPEEAIGRPITMLIPPERLGEETEILSRIRSGERVEHFETVRFTKDRRSVEVSVTVSPVRDAQGRVVGASKIARDITEQKKAQRELAQAHEELRRHASELERLVAERTAELKASLEEMETFASSLSHDLKAPLRSITGYTQALQEDYGAQLPPPAGELLSKVIGTCSRVSHLIDDVLRYSRLGNEKAQMRRIDLNKLVPEIVEDYAPAVPEAKVELMRPLMDVTANEALLTQAVANLVSNALKFVRPGVHPRLRVWTECRGGTVRLWFQDNGIGISESDQERVFGLFSRLENAHAYEGSGVGLAFVQRAVRRMGGQVGVVSEPGTGSAFWLELQACEAEKARAGAETPTRAQLQPTI